MRFIKLGLVVVEDTFALSISEPMGLRFMASVLSKTPLSRLPK